jgi:hypothetical protein
MYLLEQEAQVWSRGGMLELALAAPAVDGPAGETS